MSPEEIEKQFELINGKLERLAKDMRKIRRMVEEIQDKKQRYKEDQDYRPALVMVKPGGVHEAKSGQVKTVKAGVVETRILGQSDGM